MNDGEEILGKADALLSRYKPGPSHQEVVQTDFPILTEVVEEATIVASSAVQPHSLTALSANSSAATLDQELQLLENELRHGILNIIEPQLAIQLGELLESRIREHLGRAINQLAAEIANAAREEATEMVRQAISVAIKREIMELQAQTKD